MPRCLSVALLLLLWGCGCPRGAVDSADSRGDSGHSGPAWDPWADGEIVHALLPEGRVNHLMNGALAVDQERDRVVSVAFMTASLVVVDALDGSIERSLELGSLDQAGPLPAVDGEGTIWVAYEQSNTVVRVDPDSGEQEHFSVPLGSDKVIAPRPEGGVLLAGATEDGHGLVLVDAAGGVELHLTQDEAVLAATALADGEHFAVALQEPSSQAASLVRIDAETLDPVEAACPVSLPPVSIAETPDGVLVAMDSADLAVPACDGSGDEQRAAFGFLGTELAVAPDGALLALDRRGLEDEHGLLVGRAYRFTMPDLTLEAVHPTGQNAGYGRIHEATGTLWINGEDQGELIGLDPDSGELRHRVEVATHLEYAAVDPDDPAVLYLTGRLSHLVARLDLRDGILEHASGGDPAGWPIAPLIVDGELWYLEQTRTQLRRVALEAMAFGEVVETGREDNELHTFGGLAWHPERDSFFVANSKDHEVFELDRVSGEVLSSWSLGGMAIHPTDHGIVEVRVHDGRVFATQSHSSVVTVIDPDQGEPVAEVKLADDEVDALSGKTDYQISWVHRAAGVLYVGGHAFDIDSLERLSDRDLELEAVVGELAGGELVGWRAFDGTAVVYGPDLQELGTVELDQGEVGKPLFLVDDHWGGRLITSNMATATLRVIPLAELLER